MFMPDAMSAGDAPAGEGDRVVIGAHGGSAFMSFDEDGFYFTIGGVSMTLTGDGVTIVGGAVTHNGKNIGDTHEHTGVTPGGALTGPPA